MFARCDRGFTRTGEFAAGNGDGHNSIARQIIWQLNLDLRVAVGSDEVTLEPGSVFVAFCWAEAAINKLTNPALDPFAKIPEFKYCAIRVSLGGEAPPQGSYGGGQALRKLTAAGAA